MNTDTLVPYVHTEPLPLDPSEIILRPTEPEALINARTDAEAVKLWLVRYADTPRTYANYRKEADRLLHWLKAKGMKLADLRHDHFDEYKDFLANPPNGWVCKRKYARNDPNWRPFSSGQSLASIRQSKIVINGMLNWLVTGRYLPANPLALARNPPRKSVKRVTRFLSGAQIGEILQTVQAIENPLKRARCRWIIVLLYLTMARSAEVLGAKMGDVVREPSRNGYLWWLNVLGKGAKEGKIPVTDELLLELQAYRIANGLNPMPAENEQNALIMRLEGDKTTPITASMLHTLLKGLGKDTAERLKRDGRLLEADSLERSSAHWYRHSGASALAYHVDVPTLRDILRHENISTTSIYMHIEDENKHSSMNKNHRLPTAN